LGPADLSRILQGLPPSADPAVLVGHATSDDAAVYRLSPDLALVQTVDFFSPIVDDAFQFGAIAAANALSDVYAMGGLPRTALNIACFPQTGVPDEILRDILRGGLSKAQEAGVAVVGGHTVVDEEIKFGMAVTGLVHPDRILRNVGARPGDALVLTKALGTGIVTTALKRGGGTPAEHAAAVDSMLALNAAASAVLGDFDVHACTDVTGFGLLGHAYEIAHGSGVRAVFEAGRLPELPGARRLAGEGQLSAGCRRNRDWLVDKIELRPGLAQDLAELAWDPQTSGGLLISLPADSSARLVDRLHAVGVTAAATVGTVEPRPDGPWVVLR
jgi:selenide,water dikinase